MTMDELKQEVKEYLRFQTQLNGGGIFHCNILNLILGFAEPKERQIAELRNEIADLKNQVKYYQAREQESGWLRVNELSHEEFCELNDFLNVAYEENKDIYKEACESVSKVWDRIAVARCGVWEMMFERMYIQAYRKGKDSEVEK